MSEAATPEAGRNGSQRGTISPLYCNTLPRAGSGARQASHENAIKNTVLPWIRTRALKIKDLHRKFTNIN